MQRLQQNQIAKELGISKSYLSMILSGKRQAPPQLIEKLQAIPGVHNLVNFSIVRSASQARSRGFESHHPLHVYQSIFPQNYLYTSCQR
jgi:transcriptional regulator with XRE-family HTH domain